MERNTHTDRSTCLSDQIEAPQFAIPFEGSSPVQAWGSVGADQRFYFRWRGKNASLSIGPPAAVQPQTAAELWAAIAGTSVEEARTEVDETQLRDGEVYPEGSCVTETTMNSDNLDDAPNVFQRLLAQYVTSQRGK